MLANAVSSTLRPSHNLPEERALMTEIFLTKISINLGRERMNRWWQLTGKLNIETHNAIFMDDFRKKAASHFKISKSKTWVLTSNILMYIEIHSYKLPLNIYNSIKHFLFPIYSKKHHLDKKYNNKVNLTSVWIEFFPW